VKFGDLVNALNDPDLDALVEQVASVALWFTYVGIATALASFAEVALPMLVADRLVARMKGAFLASALRQETAHVLHGGTGNKVGAAVHQAGLTLGGLAVGFYYSWQLTLVVCSFLPLLAGSGVLLKVAGSRFDGQSQGAYGAANAVATEALGALRTVVAFGRERLEAARYGAQLAVAERAGVAKGAASGAALGFAMFGMLVADGVGLWYGADRVLASRAADPARCDPNVAAGAFNDAACFTGGTVLQVFFGVLMGLFAVGQVGPYVAAISAARVAGAKLFEVIDRAPRTGVETATGTGGGAAVDARDAVVAGAARGRIEFRDVHFTYPSRPDEPVLRGVSFVAEPGTTVALVGPSGCGKSTLVALMERFYDAGAGAVLVDGADVREGSLDALRAGLGLVSQEPILFATSVAENIAFGAGGLERVSRAAIEAAARAAQAHEFIARLPQGYDTDVGPSGATQLSGGQKQRIAIARALVRNPHILLLDEATSALDNESERQVQAALDALLADGSRRTTLVIAHRLSTIRGADKIVVLDRGSVVEEGSHAELVGREGGLYASLVRASERTPADPTGAGPGAGAGAGPGPERP
jgi:ATP-binding cassette subfamily B (MDR/TAP) protein 1